MQWRTAVADKGTLDTATCCATCARRSTTRSLLAIEISSKHMSGYPPQKPSDQLKRQTALRTQRHNSTKTVPFPDFENYGEIMQIKAFTKSVFGRSQSTKAKVIAISILFSVCHSAMAAENTAAKVGKIVYFNGYQQVMFSITGGNNQPPKQYIWFDATTADGKNVLSALVAAQLASKTIDVAWDDTLSQGLATQANKFAALVLLP